MHSQASKLSLAMDETEFAGHFVHGSLPQVGLKVPALHAMHGPPAKDSSECVKKDSRLQGNQSHHTTQTSMYAKGARLQHVCAKCVAGVSPFGPCQAGAHSQSVAVTLAVTACAEFAGQAEQDSLPQTAL